MLHVGSGDLVWSSGPGEVRPACSGLEAARFVESPRFESARRVRVIGLAAQAGLVAAAYERLTARGGVLELCGPAALGPAGRLGSAPGSFDPRHAFEAMGGADMGLRYRRPAVGPHRCGPVEAASYGLVAASGAAPPDYAALAAHPVPYRLCFLALHEPSLLRLMALILDPRWFVDGDRVDSAKKLLTTYLYMRRDSTHWRYRLARDAWKLAEADPGDPSGWVHRVHGRLLRAGEPEDVADYGATVWFMRLLRGTWLNLIHEYRCDAQGYCRGRPASESAALEPEYFFRDPRDADVVEAFRLCAGRGSLP